MYFMKHISDRLAADPRRRLAGTADTRRASVEMIVPSMGVVLVSMPSTKPSKAPDPALVDALLSSPDIGDAEANCVVALDEPGNVYEQPRSIRDGTTRRLQSNGVPNISNEHSLDDACTTT